MYSYIKLASTAINIILRICLKNQKDYVIDNAVDLANLSVGLGLYQLDALDMQANINKSIILITREMSESKMFESIDEDGKNLIISTLTDDFYFWADHNADITAKIITGRDIKKEIAEHSIKERQLWDEKLNGTYENGLRYLSAVFVEYAKGLDSFSKDAFIELYKRVDQLEENLTNQIETLTNIIKKSITAEELYQDFEKDYLTQIDYHYRNIHLIGAGIDDIEITDYNVMTSFVNLNCIKDENDDNSKNVTLEKLIKDTNIVWLVGEAGCGKTTFVQWLAVSASTKGFQSEYTGGLIPLVVKLRNVDFPFEYEQEMNKVVAGVGQKCPDGYMKSLIANDRLLLLLDGMDEISIENRKKIVDLVQQLYEKLLSNATDTNRSIQSKIFITSRPYIKDNLRISHSKYTIDRMRLPQIRTFIQKWHYTILSKKLSPEEIDKWIESVITKVSESSSLRSIATTPLLCAMICAINYYKNGNIPTQKYELYEQCCKMLIDDRDRERKIDGDSRYLYLSYLSKTIVLQKIAYHMLRCEKTETNKESIIDYLRCEFKDKTIFNDEDRDNPDGILDYLIARTGIIRELSLGKIDFVHKTFLEFLAAKEINSSCLWDEIVPRVRDYFWKEAIIMCFWNMDSVQASHILNEFISGYYKRKDNEIILMASMCANAAISVDVSVKKEIEKNIESLIPPTQSQIIALSQTGEYVLPFLSDNEDYNDEEKLRCIEVLNNMVDEVSALNLNDFCLTLLSYITGCGSSKVKNMAAEAILELPETTLSDNDVRKKVTKMYLSSSRDSISITSSVIKLLDPAEITESINNLHIEMIPIYDYAMEQYYVPQIPEKVFGIFRNASRVYLENISYKSDLEFLENLGNLVSLEVKAANNGEKMIDYIGKSCFAPKLKNFVFEAQSLEHIYYNDLSNMIELEELELIITNPYLDYNIFAIDKFPKLKKFSLTIFEAVYQDYSEKFDILSEDDSVKVTINIERGEREADFYEDEIDDWDSWSCFRR